MNNIFDKLLDINEASKRYDLTPQAIKSAIKTGKIKEDIDCKKFGNSWVFIRTSLDIIFRERLTEDKKPLTLKEKNMLCDMGKDFIIAYKNKFDYLEAQNLCMDMNNYLHNNDKNSFVHSILEKTLDCEHTIHGELTTYCIDDSYYPESCYCILFGMSVGLNDSSLINGGNKNE